MCDHQNARCVDSTEPKDKGRFREEYRCECGAIGFVAGKEQQPPSEWKRWGEVFE